MRPEVLWIAGMAGVRLGVRYPVLALFGKIPMPEPILRALKYVPPAVLTAIIVPAMLFKNDQLSLSYTNDFLVAGIISAGVARRNEKTAPDILGGVLGSLVCGGVFLAGCG